MTSVSPLSIRSTEVFLRSRRACADEAIRANAAASDRVRTMLRKLRRLQLRKIFEDLARGVVAGPAGDAAARMRRRSAHEKGLDRTSVVGVAEHRAGAEQLIDPQLPVKNVAADKRELSFKVERRQIG